jgi:hypothetical protein
VQYDGLDVHYAAQNYLSNQLHAGRIPFWTPFIFSGFPFLADLQVGAWYPLNWPFFAVGITPRSLGAELLLHDLIACLGAFALAYRLLRSAWAAVLSGIAYGLSGWFATHSQHVGMFDTAAWLPWLMLLLLHLAERITPRRLAMAGLLGAAIALPGHFQLALYTFSFVGVWVASEALAQRSWTVARRLALGLITAGVWGGLLAAVMIVPALELVMNSDRAQLNALLLPDIGYFHVGSLLTLVDPNYYGLLSGHYFGPGDSTQHYFYAGLLAVPLAALGLRNRSALRTAAVLALPFLWYAAGPNAGLFRLVARLPGFGSVELPMHGWFLPALGLALLGGAGLGIAERRIGSRWCVAVIGIVAVDVLVVNQLLNPLAYARQSVQSAYGGALDAFAAEVASAQPAVRRIYGEPLAQVGYRNHALQSRVETTYGYNPLELAAYAQYAGAAESNPKLIAGMAASHQLLDNRRLAPLTQALPLAWFPPHVAAERTLATADPTQETMVAAPMPEVQADPRATATVALKGLDWIVVHYVSATPNLLRVAIPAYPGWQATLNGAELPIVRADVAFMGVVVPPGEGDVRLSYSPRVFALGASVSALAILALLGVFCLRPRGGRRRTPGATGQLSP